MGGTISGEEIDRLQAEYDRRCVSELERRIRELEAEVERMRPLVDIVCSWADGYDEGRIGEDAVLTEVTEYYGRVAAYEASQPK